MDAHRPLMTRLPAGLSVTGDLTSQEDINIEGRLDGQITVPDHHVFIHAAAVVKGKIIANSVTIQGNVDGTVVASERIVIESMAIVRGHLVAPALALREGAQVNGTVDPERSEAATHVARYRQKQAADLPKTG